MLDHHYHKSYKESLSIYFFTDFNKCDMNANLKEDKTKNLTIKHCHYKLYLTLNISTVKVVVVDNNSSQPVSCDTRVCRENVSNVPPKS
jgi:hypothetical protein